MTNQKVESEQLLLLLNTKSLLNVPFSILKLLRPYFGCTKTSPSLRHFETVGTPLRLILCAPIDQMISANQRMQGNEG